MKKVCKHVLGFFKRSRSKGVVSLNIALIEFVLLIAILTSSSNRGIYPVMSWSYISINQRQDVANAVTPTPQHDQIILTSPTPVNTLIPSAAGGSTPIQEDSQEGKTEVSPKVTSGPETVLTPSPESEPTPALQPLPDEVQQPQNKQINEKIIRYPVNSFHTEKPEVFLTFDDGYSSESITHALNVLRERNIKCTFFIVGEALRINPDLWKQAVEDGHLICNHTASHKFLSDLSDDQIINEIYEWELAAIKVLGEDYVNRMKKEFPLIRLPGGMGSKSENIMNILADKGYIPIGWSVETVYGVMRHYNLKTEPVEPIAEKITAYVIKSSVKGSIILLHFNSYDVLTLDKTIQGIIDKGLEFKLITEALR